MEEYAQNARNDDAIGVGVWPRMDKQSYIGT